MEKIIFKKIRKRILELSAQGQSCHIGGNFSCVEILACLYGQVMKKALSGEECFEDKFILSKGHAELALYAVLEQFDLLDIEYDEFKKFGSKLQGHPDKRYIPQINYSSGVLGQGLSYGIGQAVVGKKEKFNVYVLLGDGELQEGQIYEAAIAALRYNLNNLYVIVDVNGYQLSGATFITGDTKRNVRIWRALGWNAYEIDGHSENQIINVLKIKSSDKPCVIFAKTIKGHGVSFMENNYKYHSKVLTKSEISEAIIEIGGIRDE